MRDIKFRAWDSIRKVMNYGHSVTISIGGAVYYLPPSGEWQCDEEPYIITLQQYTNLNDKNGKEIYDGDIIKWFGPFDMEYMQVYWRNGAWHFKRFQSGGFDWDKVDTTEISVIGNIYENPELLK